MVDFEGQTTRLVDDVEAHAFRALLNARDVYTRRAEGVSVWVVPSSAITASDPDEADAMFEPFEGQDYRHATSYDIPEEVGHM